mgnify:CR=1 FL=1
MGVCTLNNQEIRYTDLVNQYNSAKPSDVHMRDALSYHFYYNALLHLCYSIFEFDNLPDNWDRDYMLNQLFIRGGFCVCNTELGVLPLMASTSCYNVYNKPTKCLIANNVLGSFEKIIGKDCVYVNLGWEFDYFITLSPVINLYAGKLANCDGAIATNLMNSRVSLLFVGNDNAEIASMKKAYDNFTKGDPAIFLKTKSTINKPDLFFNNVKNTYIVDELQDSKDDIYNEFLTYIGINNANTNKKERMNVDEVNVNNQSCSSHVFSWYYNVKKEIDRVNEMFGLDIQVRLNQPTERGIENEPKQPDETV